MRGERIEWEAIECDCPTNPYWLEESSLARRSHYDFCIHHPRIRAALEAGEGMAVAQEAIAAHWSACEACQDEGCCEEIAMSDLWKHRDDAVAAWRRCVAPRGEGA